jgi:tetratricopeptide (TPR) repeat protein
MLGRGSPLWFSAAGEVATAAGKLYHRELLEDVGERLRNLGDGQGAGGPEVAATACCAFQLYFHGLYALAGSLLDRIERIDAEVRDRDPAIRARIQQARSSRAMYAGDAGEYLEMETAAVESFEQAGDVRSATMQRGYAGYACLEMGAWAEAEQQLRAALEGGERLGLPNVVASAKHNLGRAIAHLGRFDEARRMEQQAIAEFGAQGDKRLEAGSHLYMGEILLALGDIGAAELELELALVNIPPPLLPQALALRAQVLLADDRAPEALQTIERALVRMAEVGSVEEGEALIRLSLAEALYATGRRDEARHAVAQARDRVMERADKIRDPARRRCFLDSVPENARTLALARALGA